MAFQRLLSVTTGHSILHVSLLNLPHLINSNIPPLALLPQSNGQAERTIQTAKRLLKNAKDPYMALLTYRSTPLAWCNLSPAELFMGRCLRTTLPQVNDQLIPQWKYLETFRKQNKEFKQRQKSAYDRRHRTSSLPPIADDIKVWITSGQTALPGQIISHANTPRSYIVNTPVGQIRRNRQHLNVRATTTNYHRTVTQRHQRYLDLLLAPGQELTSALQIDFDIDLEEGRCSMMLTLDWHAMHTHCNICVTIYR